MKRTTNSGKGQVSARTLRLKGETVRKLSVLSEAQLGHAAGGGGVGGPIHSLDDFCEEDTIYCPA
jgi:hypothetical protein